MNINPTSSKPKLKTSHDYVVEFVKTATQEELIDVIHTLYLGTSAGVAGMTGEDYTGVCRKPKTKKEAIERALRYCEAVKNRMSRVIRRLPEEE